MLTTSPPALWVWTFLVSLVAGLVPVMNVEVYLLGAASLAPQAGILPLLLASSLGQMVAKSVLYLGGRGSLRIPFARNKEGKVAELCRKIERQRGGTAGVVLVSAVSGIPPFYVVSLAVGMLRFPFGRFVLLGSLGRLLRFGAVLLIPRAVGL